MPRAVLCKLIYGLQADKADKKEKEMTTKKFYLFEKNGKPVSDEKIGDMAIQYRWLIIGVVQALISLMVGEKNA